MARLRLPLGSNLILEGADLFRAMVGCDLVATSRQLALAERCEKRPKRRQVAALQIRQKESVEADG
jgi:hypothetical protein